jgi:hypothetical protein
VVVPLTVLIFFLSHLFFFLLRDVDHECTVISVDDVTRHIRDVINTNFSDGKTLHMILLRSRALRSFVRSFHRFTVSGFLYIYSYGDEAHDETPPATTKPKKGAYSTSQAPHHTAPPPCTVPQPPTVR